MNCTVPLAVILLHSVPSANMTVTEPGTKFLSNEMKNDLSLKIWAEAPVSIRIRWLGGASHRDAKICSLVRFPVELCGCDLATLPVLVRLLGISYF